MNLAHDEALLPAAVHIDIDAQNGFVQHHTRKADHTWRSERQNSSARSNTENSWHARFKQAKQSPASEVDVAARELLLASVSIVVVRLGAIVEHHADVLSTLLHQASLHTHEHHAHDGKTKSRGSTSMDGCLTNLLHVGVCVEEDADADEVLLVAHGRPLLHHVLRIPVVCT